MYWDPNFSTSREIAGIKTIIAQFPKPLTKEEALDDSGKKTKGI
jgi:hypothetical protein